MCDLGGLTGREGGRDGGKRDWDHVSSERSGWFARELEGWEGETRGLCKMCDLGGSMVVRA